MYSKLNSYRFRLFDSSTTIKDFLNNLENYVSCNSNQEILEIKENFYIMLNNFQKIMHYGNIDEKWNTKHPHIHNTTITRNIEKIKDAIKKILIKGFLNEQHINLIFEFHRYKPFTTNIITIYKLLINTILTLKPETIISVEEVLYLYLTHAINYNNSDAIKILLEEYHVSPIKIWALMPIQYKYNTLSIMPIIQITNPEQFDINKRFFNVSQKDKEYNFILILHNINFSDSFIKDWQLQEIFRCAFKNNFFQAIQHLLEQEMFCKHLILTEEDLIMMAFSSIIAQDYIAVVNTILHNRYILSNNNFQVQDIKTKVHNYISILTNIENATIIPQKIEHALIKTIIDFTKKILDISLKQHDLSTTLTDDNPAFETLKKDNLKLQEEIYILQETLKKSNSTLKSLSLAQSSNHTRLYNNLETQFNAITINAQIIKDEYEYLFDKHFKFLEIYNKPTQTSPTASSENIAEQLIEEKANRSESTLNDSQKLKRRHSYYL